MSRIFALLLPFGVVLTAWEALDAPEVRQKSAYADALDRTLAETPPGIVIVGNSKAMQDIDKTALAAALDSALPIVQLVVTGSASPAWYAVMAERVWGGGYRPEQVVVYGQFGAMLREDVLSDTERALIEGMVDTPDPLLDARIFGRSGSRVGRAQEAGFRRHETTVAWWRSLTVGALFGAPDLGEADGGRTVAAVAFDQVFGADAGVRTSGNTRMVPGEQADGPSGGMADGAAGLAFVDGLLAAGRQHGARMLFVRAPVAAQARARDAVPEAVESAFYDHLNAAGASWIDLHDLALPAGAFRDDYHLVKAGAAVLTEALAARMRAGGLLEGGVLPAGPPYGPRAVTRAPETSAPLEARPRLAPGESLTWQFDGPPPGSEPRATLVVYAAGAATGSVRVAGAPVALQPFGRVLRAEAPLPAGPFEITLRADPGASLTVEQLTLTGREPHLIAGESWAETHLLQSRPQFATVPPVLGPFAGLAEGELQTLEIQAFAAFAEETVNDKVGRACSPVELSNDPANFPTAQHALLPALRRHDGVASAGSTFTIRRAGAGTTWYARLNPDRSCTRGTRYFPGWLYSGDVATVTVGGARIAAHRLGADRLEVQAAAFGGESTLRVTVRRRGPGGLRPEWTGTLVVPEAAGLSSWMLPIEPPLSTQGKREVEFSVAGGSLLVFDAKLVESESVPGGAAAR